MLFSEPADGQFVGSLKLGARLGSLAQFGIAGSQDIPHGQFDVGRVLEICGDLRLGRVQSCPDRGVDAQPTRAIRGPRRGQDVILEEGEYGLRLLACAFRDLLGALCLGLCLFGLDPRGSFGPVGGFQFAVLVRQQLIIGGNDARQGDRTGQSHYQCGGDHGGDCRVSAHPALPSCQQRFGVHGRGFVCQVPFDVVG